MDADYVDILARHPVPRRRLTVAEYYRLGEIGILGENDHVELLEGQLVEMSPIGPRHALALDALIEILVIAAAGQATVRAQNPVTLDGGSEPQPDLALVPKRWQGYPKAHPGPADIFLLIEISDSSLDVDRGAKLALYAKSGVREVWIVDLTKDVVHVHRQPRGLAYQAVTVVKAPETLEVEALPGLTVPAAAIFA